MDINARIDVNCGRKDGRTGNRTPISHLAGETKHTNKTMLSQTLMNTSSYFFFPVSAIYLLIYC